MKFAQTIEFKTSRIDDFHANLDAWITRTEGSRIPHRAVLSRDRDADDRYLLMVEFADYGSGMENSDRAEDVGFRGRTRRDLRGDLTFPQPRRDPRGRPLETPSIVAATNYRAVQAEPGRPRRPASLVSVSRSIAAHRRSVRECPASSRN